MSKVFLCGSKGLSLSLLLVVGLMGVVSAKLKVVTTHPLMTDLVQRVGGAEVEVVAWMTKSDDPHNFNLKTSDIRRAEGVSLYVLSGKGLEGFTDKLVDNVGKQVPVLALGDRVPDLTMKHHCSACAHDHGEDGHDAGHTHSEVDPHWWHSVRSMRRAVLVLGAELGKLDEVNREAYRERASVFAAELTALDKWVKAEVAKVPRESRKLVSSHAAFGYFCHDYGFDALPVLGLTPEEAASPARLREVSQLLSDQSVVAVFPEEGINPKIIEELAKQAKLKVGTQLNGDGMADCYVSMVKGNVKAVVEALAQ